MHLTKCTAVVLEFPHIKFHCIIENYIFSQKNYVLFFSVGLGKSFGKLKQVAVNKAPLKDLK